MPQPRALGEEVATTTELQENQKRQLRIARESKYVPIKETATPKASNRKESIRKDEEFLGERISPRVRALS